MNNQYIGQLVVTEYYNNELKINYILGIVVDDNLKGYKHTTYKVQWLAGNEASSVCTEDEIKTMMNRYNRYRQTNTGLFA